MIKDSGNYFLPSFFHAYIEFCGRLERSFFLRNPGRITFQERGFFILKGVVGK